MLERDRSITTHRRLLVFKWLMVSIPPATVTVAHSLPRHAVGRLTGTLIVATVALALSYFFAETMFRVLRKLQADAMAREQDILTMNAVMGERERLSRELHDGAAQLVALLLLRLDTIKELVATDRQPEAQAELERLHGVADEIYVDIGESISGIRANMEERGLAGALRDYIDQFEEHHGIRVALHTDDAAERLSPPAASQVFRLVQEALTNVRKHAEAGEATVTLLADGPDRLRVVVGDDGRGFVPGGQRDGKLRPIGLSSMRERVEALGGLFEVSSRPGSGAQVSATVPLRGPGRAKGRGGLATTAR